MAEEGESTKSTTLSYILRGFLGLFLGAVIGAAIGAAVLILLHGWGDYTRALGSNRPAGIISATGTESSFVRALTFAFAFWGAVIGAPLGFIAGLFTALGKQLASPRRRSSRGLR